MKVIACYSVKGGVGKTASAVNLAYLMAEAGYRTLLWDLDPQGASSFYLRVAPRLRGGARRLIAGKVTALARIRGSDFERLDLLPADHSLRKLDIVLAERGKPRQQLVALLQQVQEQYDRLIIDCPPGLSLATEAMLTVVDLLAVPVVPNELSLRTLRALGRHLEKRRRKDRSVPAVAPFFSMVDRRKQLHRSIVGEPPSEPYSFLDTYIPFSSAVERMELRRAPLVSFDHRGPAALAYRALRLELAERL